VNSALSSVVRHSQPWYSKSTGLQGAPKTVDRAFPKYLANQLHKHAGI